ncbi:MAG: hypothetical protein ACTSXL_03260 [Alphaproteobacteria bacterium]
MKDVNMIGLNHYGYKKEHKEMIQKKLTEAKIPSEYLLTLTDIIACPNIYNQYELFFKEDALKAIEGVVLFFSNREKNHVRKKLYQDLFKNKIGFKEIICFFINYKYTNIISQKNISDLENTFDKLKNLKPFCRKLRKGENKDGEIIVIDGENEHETGSILCDQKGNEILDKNGDLIMETITIPFEETERDFDRKLFKAYKEEEEFRFSPKVNRLYEKLLFTMKLEINTLKEYAEELKEKAPFLSCVSKENIQQREGAEDIPFSYELYSILQNNYNKFKFSKKISIICEIIDIFFKKESDRKRLEARIKKHFNLKKET